MDWLLLLINYTQGLNKLPDYWPIPLISSNMQVGSEK